MRNNFSKVTQIFRLWETSGSYRSINSGRRWPSIMCPSIVEGEKARYLGSSGDSTQSTLEANFCPECRTSLTISNVPLIFATLGGWWIWMSCVAGSLYQIRVRSASSAGATSAPSRSWIILLVILSNSGLVPIRDYMLPAASLPILVAFSSPTTVKSFLGLNSLSSPIVPASLICIRDSIA